MEISWIQVGWFFLLMFQLSFALLFFNTYRKDKDKRKLMFGISFLVLSYSHCYEIVFTSIPLQHPLFQLAENMQYWSFYPVLFAIGIAVHQRFFQINKFTVFFRLFSVLSVATFLLIVFNPISALNYAGLLAIAIGMECMILAGIIFLKHKELPDSFAL